MVIPRISHTPWTDTYMLLFSDIGELTHNELFQDPKPKLVGAPYKIKECNSFYLALILIGCNYSKGNGRETSDMKTQQ